MNKLLERYVDVTVSDSYYGIKAGNKIETIITRCRDTVNNNGFISGWGWDGKSTEFSHSQEYCESCKYRFRCYTMR